MIRPAPRSHRRQDANSGDRRHLYQEQSVPASPAAASLWGPTVRIPVPPPLIAELSRYIKLLEREDVDLPTNSPTTLS